MTEENIQHEKKRHGCLTAYLIFMIIANSASALSYIVFAGVIKQNLPSMPSWAFPVFIIAGLFNLTCAIALLKWKKWGFWGFCISAGIILPINLMVGLSPASAIGGILGIAILYGILQIGTEPQLG
jgi:hypothetical protein